VVVQADVPGLPSAAVVARAGVGAAATVARVKFGAPYAICSASDPVVPACWTFDQEHGRSVAGR
jgi:hypothetical protein